MSACTKKLLSVPHSARRIIPKYFTLCVHKLNQSVLVFWINLKSSIMYCFELELSAELLMSLMRFVVEQLQSCSPLQLGLSTKTCLWGKWACGIAWDSHAYFVSWQMYFRYKGKWMWPKRNYRFCIQTTVPIMHRSITKINNLLSQKKKKNCLDTAKWNI